MNSKSKKAMVFLISLLMLAGICFLPGNIGIPQVKAEGVWTFVDGGSSTGLNFNTTQDAGVPHQAIFNGALYAAWPETNGTANQIRVKKYNGFGWSWVDGGGTNGVNWDPAMDATNPVMMEYINNLYMAWEETAIGTGRIHVKRYNGVNSWVSIDDGVTGLNFSAAASAGAPALAVFNGELYAAWQENALNGKDQIRVKKYDGASWSFVDGAGDTGLNYNNEQNADQPKLVIFNAGLYAVWEEINGGAGQIRVKRYDGGNAWTFIDGGTATGLNWDVAKDANHPELIEYNGKLYATWEEQSYYDTTSSTYIKNIRLKKFDGTSWTFADGGGNAGFNKNPASPATNPSMDIFNNLVYLTWCEEDVTNHIRQIRAVIYNGITRSFIDGDTTTGLNKNIAMHGETPFIKIFNGDPYIAWCEKYGAVNQIRMKKLPLPAIVTSVTVPPGNSYGTGQTLDFTVNFSKNVIVSGANPSISLTLNTGGTVFAQYVSGTGTNALIFRYTVQSGNLDTDGVSLGGSITAGPGGTIGDVDNNANLTLNNEGSTAEVLVDGVASRILTVTVPANGTYIIGQNLDFTVNFSESVTVDTSGGTPCINALFDTGVGTNSVLVNPSYISGSGTNTLWFRYTIKSGDRDTNGISVLTGSSFINANGGAIRDAAMNNAVLAFNNLGMTPGILVDGVAPAFSMLMVSATPPLCAGKTIEFNVKFSETILVNTTGGVPYIPVNLDTGTVNASYVSGSGNWALVFRYTIQTEDLDMNGVSIGDSIITNGGTIRDTAGNNAVLALGTWNGSGIQIDTVAPTVVSVSAPQDGIYGITGPPFGGLIFTVNFNEPVKVTNGTGTAYIPVTLDTGGVVRANYSSGSGTNALVFKLATQAGNQDMTGISVGTSIIANGSTLTDNFTNNAILTLNNVGSTAGVFIDTAPSTVVSVSVPANGIYVIGQNLDFTVNFNETMVVTTTGGIPYIQLNFDNTPPNFPKAYYVSGSGTSALVFRYTVLSGDIDANGIALQTSINLNGGTIKDIVFNSAVLTLNNVGNTTGVLVTAVTPRVSYISLPANGTYIAGQNLDFPVYFSEPVTVDITGGIPYVQIVIGGATVNAFYISSLGNGSLLFRYTVQPGNIDTNGISVGQSVIPNGAIFRDNINNVATIFSVTGYGNSAGVLVDGVAPMVISTGIPGQGVYTSGQNLNFTVTFSKKVTVMTTGGTSYIPITLDVGGTVNALYVSGSGTTSLTFRYTVQEGNLDTDGITLGTSILTGGGTLKDTPGNDAVLTLNNIGTTSGIKVDTIAPTVASVVVPLDGSYGAGQNLDFNVNFNEAVIVNYQYGTPYIAITLDTGGVVNASYVSGSGTNCLLFHYTVQTGNLDGNGIMLGTSIVANTGVINDISGNHSLLALNSIDNTEAILVDGIGPLLVSAVQTDNAHLSVTLNENCINITKENDGGFTVQENSERGITYAVNSVAQGADSSNVILTVANMDISAKMGVVIKYVAGNNGTIQDINGNSMATTNTGVTATSWSNNRLPQLATISDQTVDENQLLQFTVTGTDPDRDAVTYSALNLPSGAVLNPVTGQFNWTPDYSNSGIHHIQFNVSDGESTDSQDVTLTVIDKGTLVTIQLIDSHGIGIPGGQVTYAGSSWQIVGDTGSDGTVNILLPPSITTITVRMNYNGMNWDQIQNVRDNSTFIFQTVNSSVVLKDSAGNGLPGGVATFAGSSWISFGTTEETGAVSRELLPGSYTFRLSYGGTSNDISQNISTTNSTVIYQTVPSKVILKDSLGNGISGGIVTYAGSSWLSFGTTNAVGEVNQELLPGSYKFRMTYAGASKDLIQDVVSNPIVTFQTQNVSLALKDSLGNGISGGAVTYAGSSWLSFGTTGSNGEVRKELLPGSYKFRMTYAGASFDKTQDIGSNPEVIYQTQSVLITLKDSAGNGLSGGVATYSGSSWLSCGTTDANGEVRKELLPVSYTFRMTYGGTTNNKVQDIGTNPEVSFEF